MSQEAVEEIFGQINGWQMLKQEHEKLCRDAAQSKQTLESLRAELKAVRRHLNFYENVNYKQPAFDAFDEKWCHKHKVSVDFTRPTRAKPMVRILRAGGDFVSSAETLKDAVKKAKKRLGRV